MHYICNEYLCECVCVLVRERADQIESTVLCQQHTPTCTLCRAVVAVVHTGMFDFSMNGCD